MVNLAVNPAQPDPPNSIIDRNNQGRWVHLSAVEIEFLNRIRYPYFKCQSFTALLIE